MKRIIEEELLKWKNSSNRKPLLIFGARQIGKTYTMISFGKTNYKNYIYCNFEQEYEQLYNIFSLDMKPDRIIKLLELRYSTKIFKEDTLIIFDEIQNCQEALTSLKYFNEEANDYHIICAGSLFGVALNREKYSFPVGKVDMINMYPLNFEEFLLSTNNDSLIELIKESYSTGKSMPLHDKALELYRLYLAIGGFPAVVNSYNLYKDFNLVKNEQSIISKAYIYDILKYSSNSETIKTIAIYDSIFRQFAKETTKFQYSVVKKNARSKDYETSLDWLLKSNIVYKCNQITEGRYPITAYENIDTFKIYYCDPGLYALRSDLDYDKIVNDYNFDYQTRGVMAENYVANTLKSNNFDLRYYSSNTSLLDFVIHLDGEAIPIEVKSSDNVRSRSLKIYIDKYKPKYSIKLSTKNFGLENNIYSIPLYAAFCIGKYKSIIK